MLKKSDLAIYTSCRYNIPMKTLPVTFGIALFVVAIISASALTDASALMDDGTLTKYSPNGKYKVDMSWDCLLYTSDAADE